MHKLLQRQLKKTGAVVDEKFLELVDQAYKDADEDKKLLERSLEISSREMRELYKKLQESAQHEIHKSEVRLHRILNEFRKQYFLYSFDKKFNLTYVSEAITDILGYTQKEILNTKFTTYYTNDAINKLSIELIERTLKGEHVEPFIISVLHKNGTRHYLEISSYPLTDDKDEIYGAEGLARDITQQYVLQEELTYLSSHDTLTGLANRSSLYSQLEYIIKDAKRHHESFAVFYIDLDNFKNVNDTLGHQEGDLLLKHFAQLLKRHARSNDIVARIGGDEFIIVYTDLHENTKDALIEKLFSSINKEIIPKYLSQHLSASIGIATFPNDAQTVQELLRKADIAMYRSKNSGKNKFSNY